VLAIWCWGQSSNYDAVVLEPHKQWQYQTLLNNGSNKERNHDQNSPGKFEQVSRQCRTAHQLKAALECLAVAAALHTVTAGAQTAAPAKDVAAASSPALSTALVSTSQIEGQTIEGNAFKLAALKGKLVPVMLWSTRCAICRDKMPELRTNYEGWADRPFELVAISTDTRMQDLMSASSRARLP